ncbi:hypothetical protein ACIA3K_01820 [Micromonospora sp. NPDC051543]
MSDGPAAIVQHPNDDPGLLWAVNNPFIGNESSTKIYTSGPI